MNRINFYSGDKFPMYRQALDKMQDMINLVSGLAGMGGQNFILSGCEKSVDGNTTTDGYIVVNGELLPFVGGATKSKITVKETRQDETAFNVVYPEIYITRVAMFSDVGELAWGDFEQVKSNVEIYQAIKDIVGDSPGVIKEFAGDASSIPTDYMLCDGRELSIDDYPALYQVIGVKYGGNGVSSFKLPNAVGRFSVGYGGDGDYSVVGSTGGLASVTLGVREIPKHSHVYTDDTFAQGKYPEVEPAFPQAVGGTTNLDSSTGGSSGKGTVYRTSQVGGGESHENRPPYIVFSKIIKVK